MDGNFYQPTTIIHDLSTEQGRTENQILNGSREHNFARRDFEIILDVPYLNKDTHILTSLDIQPLDLTQTTHDADSILEHANTTALANKTLPWLKHSNTPSPSTTKDRPRTKDESWR